MAAVRLSAPNEWINSRISYDKTPPIKVGEGPGNLYGNRKKMKKNVFWKISMMGAVASGCCFGSERTVLSYDFDQQIPPIKTLSGSWKKDPSGVLLKADSRIAFPSAAGRDVINGKVYVGFQTPDLKKLAMPFKPGSDESQWALKINIGRCVAEVTEKGLSLKHMDKSFGYVEAVLGSVNLPFGSHEGELTISLTITDRTATACVNDSVCLRVQALDYWFGAIELASYNSPFVLTTFSLAALSRDTLYIDKKNKRIELAGVYHPSHFNGGSGQHNHSFITWEGGTAAYNALFTTTASDSAVYDALAVIGAKPGNNLTVYPWQKINDPGFGAPDKKTTGSPLAIEVLFGGKSYPASSLLHDENNKPFDFRFSGNRKFISVMNTGCIACLESCPGGKIGNAVYSMREMVKKAARFTVNTDQPFKEADEVTIRISFARSATGGK